MKTLCIALIVVLCITACNQDTQTDDQTIEDTSAINEGSLVEENSDPDPTLVGSWKASTLKVEMVTFGGNGPDQVFEVADGEWEEKMALKPYTLNILADGSYDYTISSAEDVEITSQNGTWVFADDTLSLTKDDGSVIKEHVTVSNDERCVLRSIRDFDSDGEVDDMFTVGYSRVGTHN